MTDRNLLVPSATTEQQHISEWLDVMLDAIDGELDTSAHTRLDAHLLSCRICREEFARLSSTDAALARALPAQTLSVSFDQRVLAMAKRMEADTKEKARRRIMEEDEKALLGLKRRGHQAIHQLAAYCGAVVVATIALTIALNSVLVSVWPAVVNAFPQANLPAGVEFAGLIALSLAGLGTAAGLALGGRRSTY